MGQILKYKLLLVVSMNVFAISGIWGQNEPAQKLLKLNNLKQAQILFNLGLSAFKDRQYSLAMTYFGDFKDLYPNHPELNQVYKFEAQIYLKSLDYPKALFKLEQFFRYNHSEEGEEALFKAFELYVKMGEAQKGKKLLKMLEERNPTSRFLEIAQNIIKSEDLLMPSGSAASGPKKIDVDEFIIIE